MIPLFNQSAPSYIILSLLKLPFTQAITFTFVSSYFSCLSTICRTILGQSGGTYASMYVRSGAGPITSRASVDIIKV